MDTYRMNDDGPDETLLYFTVCKQCGWCDEEGHEKQGDCMVDECPECGSDNVVDEAEYV